MTDLSAIEGQGKGRTEEGCPRSQGIKAYCEEVDADYLKDNQARHQEASEA